MAQGLPPQFGKSWADFNQEWCIGEKIAYTPEQVEIGLSTLARHWPEEVDRRKLEPVRGISIVAYLVDLGLMLSRCEALVRFDSVMQRLREGGRSAYSEVVVVDGLVRLGHNPAFEPPLGDRVLDALCHIDGSDTYLEVVAPERSQASQDRAAREATIRAKLDRELRDCRLELDLRELATAEDAETILSAAKSAPAGEWISVGDIVRMRRIDKGGQLEPLWDGDGPTIKILGQEPSQGVFSRWEDSDDRAKRVFNDEYAHFASGVANVVVVNTSAVDPAFRVWPQAMTRLFQPGRNRKVGAVAFFSQAIMGTPLATIRSWHVVVNPHSHVSVPARLIEGLRSLD